MTESIIVYRNPLEERLWNGIMDNPNFILSLMAFCVVMFVSFLVINWALGKMMGTNSFRNARNKYNLHIAGTLSFLLGCLTIYLIL